MDKDLEQQIRNAYIEAMNKGTLPTAVRTFDDFLDYIDMLNDMDIDRESSARGGRIGLRQGTPEEGIGSLDAGASNITYEGNEGPKSPAEEMKMAGMMSDIAADFEIEHGYDMAVANPEMREAFIREWLKNNFYNKTDIPFNKGGRVGYALGTGPVLPSDEDPINPIAQNLQDQSYLKKWRWLQEQTMSICTQDMLKK